MTEQTATQDKQFTITRDFRCAARDHLACLDRPGRSRPLVASPRSRQPAEFVRINASVGGTYEYKMIAPDGSEYPTAGQYLEVVEPERSSSRGPRPVTGSKTHRSSQCNWPNLKVAAPR